MGYAGTSGSDDGPTARQLLHWATGDREAEGQALADAAGPEVDGEAGEVAVKEAHGDFGIEDSDEDTGDIADVQDAKDVAQRDG